MPKVPQCRHVAPQTLPQTFKRVQVVQSQAVTACIAPQTAPKIAAQRTSPPTVFKVLQDNWAVRRKGCQCCDARAAHPATEDAMGGPSCLSKSTLLRRALASDASGHVAPRLRDAKPPIHTHESRAAFSHNTLNMLGLTILLLLRGLEVLTTESRSGK